MLQNLESYKDMVKYYLLAFQRLTKNSHIFVQLLYLSLVLDSRVSLGDIDILGDDSQVCADLLAGDVLLVPYDCDFNHGPCLG